MLFRKLKFMRLLKQQNNEFDNKEYILLGVANYNASSGQYVPSASFIKVNNNF